MIPNRHWELLIKLLSKKGVLTWLTKKENKKNVVEEAITPHISTKKKMDTVKKTDKSQASNKTVDTPKINKPTQLNHYINQGLQKEPTHKTQ